MQRVQDEWPTLCLLGLTYAAFAALTVYAAALPLALICSGLAITIALHSSLQHEVLHGHPFRTAWLSDLTVFPALGLFIPYLRFKDTHLAHHFDPNLTDPYDDPEANYLDPIVWRTLQPATQRLLAANNTLLGRMLIGPALSLVAFYRADWRLLRAGDRRVWLSYFLHLPAVALVLLWLGTIGTLPFWAYLIAAYCGMSLLKIRTFLEHQAHDRAAARSVIIEDRGPLAVLFLNNNFHAVHHAHPMVPWHRLPALFRARKEAFLRRNGGYAYRSYAQIVALHLLCAKDTVAHPLWSQHNRTTPIKR